MNLKVWCCGIDNANCKCNSGINCDLRNDSIVICVTSWREYCYSPDDDCIVIVYVLELFYSTLLYLKKSGDVALFIHRELNIQICFLMKIAQIAFSLLIKLSKLL